VQYKPFGRTGLFASGLGFGAGSFGKARMGGDVSDADAKRMVSIALDAGVNFFDTSNVYGGGESELMLAKALGARRKDVLLATKVHARVGPGANDVGQSRVHIMRALEASLKALGTDWIDLYQLHQFDPYVRADDVMRTLDDAIRQGKVRYAGCSNFMAWQIMKASKAAALAGCEDFVSVQAWYSPVGRDIERELVPLLNDQQLALIAFSPLAGGFLSGKITREKKPAPGTRRARIEFPPLDMERAYRVVDVLAGIAVRRGATVPQLAYAWLLAKPHLTVALLGAERVDEVEQNLKAVELQLAPEELAAIDAASALPREYPSWATDLSAPREPLKTKTKESE
jgi:aryl-alcohol dehydrogenase-like predicted oxidoreductase